MCDWTSSSIRDEGYSRNASCALIYLSDDTIFQSLWFLSGFPWYRVAANKEATELRVPFGKVEVITSEILRSPPWFGWPLWNICVTNDHGYVPLVVNTSPPVFSGVRATRSLVLYACFVDRCLFFCTFSFGHCVVCSSSIYGFWLPLWYLQTLLMINREYSAYYHFLDRGLLLKNTTEAIK